MLVRYLLAFSIVSLPFSLPAAERSTGPVIDGYGAAFVVEDRDVPLVKNHIYRVVYEITAYEGAPDSVNRELDMVARFLNMHGKNGVPTQNMQLAVVIHGAALVNVLSNDSYNKRFQKDNPNLDLVQKLSAAGVKFYACGQSMGSRGFAKSELASGVQLALSAMTMVHQLQADGYTLQP
jgi:intracellular sulfur oxidation DsrE/DsrF family protein